MNYLKYLYDLSRKEYTGQKPGLGRIRKLLDFLGNPQDSCPVIHVAGTNGKGSAAAIIHSVLVEAGYRAGLYTSPHLVDFRERIRAGRQLIPLCFVEDTLKSIYKKRKNLLDSSSYFEVMTAVAFKYFAAKKVDFAVCEVGLGGRFDATNIVTNVQVSVITSIDFDHTEFFGSSLRSIAREKMGIIKKNVPLVMYSGHRETDRLIFKEAVRKNSRVYLLGRDFKCAFMEIDWKKNKMQFSYRGIFNVYPDVSLGLIGKYQLNNAGLALAATELLGKNFEIPEKALLEGAKKVSWPGRFEIVDYCYKRRKLSVILDGAHNPAGISVLIDTLGISPFRDEKGKVVFAVSILKEKNYRLMCRMLSGIAGKVIIFRANTGRALEPRILADEFRKYLPAADLIMADNLEKVFQYAGENARPFCITGSLYALGDAMRYLKRRRFN